MGFVSCIKTLTLLTFKTAYSSYTLPEILKTKNIYLSFIKTALAPPSLFYIINSGTQNKKIRSVKKLN